jgi:hypothetical protein
MRKKISFLVLAMFMYASTFAQAERPNNRTETNQATLQTTPLNVTNTPVRLDEESSPSYRMNGEIPLDGLVGYYELDNNTYVDSSPSGFDLEVAGNGGAIFPAQNRFGEPNKAVNFLNEYLSLASNPTAFDFAGGNLSIAAWIKIESTIVDWTGLLNNWGGFGLGGYFVGLTPTQQIRWNVNGDFPADTDPIPTGVWTHLVVTYDGIDANVWLDGFLVKSEANNVPIAASTFPFTVAAQADVPTLQFPGILDEILVYDRVLTAQEIQDIYTVLSIADLDAFSSQIQVYPNPASSSLSIAYDSSLGTIKSISITDSQGRLIINNTFEGSETTIDLNAMESGFYILQFHTMDGVSIAKKIIKK